MRIGLGFDQHRLVPDRRLILGGVEVPHTTGLAGHSDADVLTHAICDALLGAAGLADVGDHFPDTDPQYRDANSLELLRACVMLIRECGFEVGNIDATLIAEAPKLAPHRDTMRRNLAETLDVPVSCVSVKFTTTEGCGAIGRGEAMAAHAIALLSVLTA